MCASNVFAIGKDAEVEMVRRTRVYKADESGLSVGAIESKPNNM